MTQQSIYKGLWTVASWPQYLTLGVLLNHPVTLSVKVREVSGNLPVWIKVTAAAATVMLVAIIFGISSAPRDVPINANDTAILGAGKRGWCNGRTAGIPGSERQHGIVLSPLAMRNHVPERPKQPIVCSSPRK